MCFRPSALSQDNTGIESFTCPTCGMPISSSDVDNNVCPYCGNTIPVNFKQDLSEIDPSKNTRIL